MLCGKCTTKATKYKESIAIQASSGSDAFNQVAKLLDNVEELKIWQLRQVAKQNDIVPRGRKRRLKEHWVKAIREHQIDRLIGVGDQVIIHGLRRNPEHNRKKAQVIAWLQDKGRWQVDAGEDGCINIRPKHITVCQNQEQEGQQAPKRMMINSKSKPQKSYEEYPRLAL